MTKDNIASKRELIILGALVALTFAISITMYNNNPQQFLGSFKIIGPIMPGAKLALSLFQ